MDKQVPDAQRMSRVEEVIQQVLNITQFTPLSLIGIQHDLAISRILLFVRGIKVQVNFILYITPLHETVHRRSIATSPGAQIIRFNYWFGINNLVGFKFFNGRILQPGKLCDSFSYPSFCIRPVLFTQGKP